MNFKIVIITVLIVLFSFNMVNSSISNGFKEREILVGCNDSIFVTLAIKSTQPSFEYNYEDSAFIKSFYIKSGKLKKKELIGVIDLMSTATGVWGKGKGESYFNFDIGKFLYENFIEYAWPSINYRMDELSIQENGLVLKNKNHKPVVLVSNEVLKNKLSVNNFNNVKILQTFETKYYLFFQFQLEIQNKFVDEFIQVTIPILNPEIQKKLKLIKK